MRIKIIIICFLINGIGYSTSLDSLFIHLKNNVKIEAKYTDSIFVNNFDLKTLKYDFNTSKNNQLKYIINFDKNEIKKVTIVENEKFLFEFWLFKFNEYNIFVRRDFAFFLIDKNNQENIEYLFFQFKDDISNLQSAFELERVSKVVSVDKEFKPRTTLYLNKTIPIANSNFIYDNEDIFEEIYIYYQDGSNCFILKNKDLKFIYKYFRIKGDIICNVFKNYQIKVFNNHYQFFWFLSNYQQEYLLLNNSKFKNIHFKN